MQPSQTFISSTGHPLSRLWLLLNQLNSQVKVTPGLLSPYPKDGKRDLYDTMKLVYGECRLMDFENEQVLFLQATIKEIKPILENVPNRYDDFNWWGFDTFEEYEPVREKFREILLQAHKQAPIVEV